MLKAAIHLLTARITGSNCWPENNPCLHK